MAELGRKATLRIVRKTDFGFYLDGGSLGEILMPKRYITPGMQIDQTVEVFVFLDGEERLVEVFGMQCLDLCLEMILQGCVHSVLTSYY